MLQSFSFCHIFHCCHSAILFFDRFSAFTSLCTLSFSLFFMHFSCRWRSSLWIAYVTMKIVEWKYSHQLYCQVYYKSTAIEKNIRQKWLIIVSLTFGVDGFKMIFSLFLTLVIWFYSGLLLPFYWKNIFLLLLYFHCRFLRIIAIRILCSYFLHIE